MGAICGKPPERQRGAAGQDGVDRRRDRSCDRDRRERSSWNETAARVRQSSGKKYMIELRRPLVARILIILRGRSLPGRAPSAQVRKHRGAGSPRRPLSWAERQSARRSRAYWSLLPPDSVHRAHGSILPDPANSPIPRPRGPSRCLINPASVPRRPIPSTRRQFRPPTIRQCGQRGRSPSSSMADRERRRLFSISASSARASPNSAWMAATVRT